MMSLPKSSVLLFGPRGTGKSTWLRQNFPDATTYDFLDSREALRLERNPRVLFDELQTKPQGSWVVLDEVQKVPALMDEVHRLIETRGLKFILCGSSARKLKRAGSNLLAGRALVTRMYPLTSGEMGADFNVEHAMTRGTLPMTVTGEDPEGYLSAYAATYLKEEIRAEALTRNVGAFSRCLEVAARQNGQITNISNIAREAAVGRTTVQNYFEILVDTLIGNWLTAWKLKRSTQQVTHPKFYLFDTGVVRALSGRLPYPPAPEETGPLLETLILGEMRAYLAYRKLGYELHFWKNHDGTEVDLVCETRRGFVAVEIKAAREWQRRFNRGLHTLRAALAPAGLKAYGVFQGERSAAFDDVEILPAPLFLRMLWQDELIQ